ncbi:ribbon-helix-helix domain-containing protein [Rhodanobacter lindaniclasticus]
MRSTQQFSITLPNEMADAVKAKVAGGEYATESEVIREGLRALIAKDRAIEHWLRTEVAAAYDELKADPSKALTIDQMRTSRSSRTLVVVRPLANDLHRRLFARCPRPAHRAGRSTLRRSRRRR